MRGGNISIFPQLVDNCCCCFSDEGREVVMSDTNAAKKPTCKICCACPQERRARDECTIFKSLDECTAEINAFYKCLLKEGFSQAEVDGLRRNTRPL